MPTKKQLQEENEKLKRDIDGDGMLYKGHKKEMSDRNLRLKSSVKQIVKLKEENKKCMEELAEAILVVKLMSKAEDLNLDLQGKMVEEIEELEEENKKLKEEIEELKE